MKMILSALLASVLAFCLCGAADANAVSSTVTISNSSNEDMGYQLAVRFTTVINRYEADLSEAERNVFYLLVPEQLQNVYSAESRTAFSDALDACKSVADVRALFDGEYAGITQAAPGYPEREAIEPFADDILRDANLYDSYPYRFYGPLFAALPHAEAWAIRVTNGMKAGGAITTLYLNEDGKLYWMDHPAFLSGKLDILRPIQQEELDQAINWAASFAEKHSMIQEASEVIISDHLLCLEGVNEPLVQAFRPYLLPEDFWSEEEIVTTTYGDRLIWGLSTGVLYEFHGFISEDCLKETMF